MLSCGVGLTQAIAFWQWYNYALHATPPERTVLPINMDETAICLAQPNQRGNVCLSLPIRVVQSASLSARRTYFSFVAFICDAPHIQPYLPQVLIVNERTVHIDMLPAIRASLEE